MVTEQSVPKEAILVVNAQSRKGRALFRRATFRLRQAGIRLISAHAIRKPGELIPTVKQAVASGAPMVIVGGGDGSLSSAVDELVDRRCVFALLPLGTANSFARTLGIPLDLDARSRPSSAQKAAGGSRRHRGDYFANSAAMGLSPSSPRPCRQAQALSRPGRLHDLGRLVRLELEPFHVTSRWTQAPRDGRARVRIANGGFHGGVEVVDAAEVDSGEIVVQVVTGREKNRLAWNWIATLVRHKSRKETAVDFHARKLTLITDPPLPISIDGELLGHTPATVEVAEMAIEVVVPV